MTAPRQPQTWYSGDPEPTKVTGVALKVRDTQGDVWTYNDRNGRWYSPETAPFSWDHIARKWGPLEEVLPETPEPPKASVSETVSRIATLMAQDSEERTADQTAELMQLKATLDEVIAIRDDVNEIVQDQTKRWGMCEMNKLAELLHFRGYRKAVPAPQSSPAPLLPLSAPVETEGQVEGRTEALRADVALTIAESLKGSTEEDFFRAAAAVIADFGRRGWRPPPCNCLPFDVCDECWGPEQQRESQTRQLAYCEEIIPCGPEDADQCPNLREPGSVHCAQHQSSPLPADEGQLVWGWQSCANGEFFALNDEAQARRFVASCNGRVRLACARWVAVPVEPKETNQ